MQFEKPPTQVQLIPALYHVLLILSKLVCLLKKFMQIMSPLSLSFSREYARLYLVETLATHR